MRRIKLMVQYDGAPFQGWQFQATGPTVQSALEEALAELTGQAVRVMAAGRTDTGVHAMAMPVHFDLDSPIPAERLPLALNKFLPPAVSILTAEDVPDSFDARRNAIMRWYRYQILKAPRPRPLGPRAWRVARPLDEDAIEQGLELLLGRHDFSGFRSSKCQSYRTVLKLEEARLTRAGNLLAFDFKCRSFLHHMVRFMVGTLISMGQGKLDTERMLRILERGERPRLILCAPPEGLCLMGVAYSQSEREALLAASPPPPSF